jgi:hypothetical protein
MSLPPLDSQIRLKPGGSVSIDAELQKEWIGKADALKRIRGEILAFGFEVEYSIDMIISQFFFPDSPARSETPKKLFDELFLKSFASNFARKLEVFKVLSRDASLASLVSTSLLENLNRVKDLRNRFAHYPITFDPTTELPYRKLIPRLVCRDKEVTLDDPSLREFQELFASVRSDLDGVIARCDPDQPRTTQSVRSRFLSEQAQRRRQVAQT